MRFNFKRSHIKEVEGLIFRLNIKANRVKPSSIKTTIRMKVNYFNKIKYLISRVVRKTFNSFSFEETIEVRRDINLGYFIKSIKVKISIRVFKRPIIHN